MEIMTGNTFMNIPISPLSMRSGRKANTVVKVAVSTAGNISKEPSIAASLGDLPISICLKIFSATTMASSTSIPSAINAPKRVSILRLYPIISAAIKVIIKLAGIPMATTNAIL